MVLTQKLTYEWTKKGTLKTSTKTVEKTPANEKITSEMPEEYDFSEVNDAAVLITKEACITELATFLGVEISGQWKLLIKDQD